MTDYDFGSTTVKYAAVARSFNEDGGDIDFRIESDPGAVLIDVDQNYAVRVGPSLSCCPYCGNRSKERDRRGNCIACGGPR